MPPHHPGAKRPSGGVRDVTPVAHRRVGAALAVAVGALAIAIVCFCAGTLRRLCRVAGSPVAPLWMQACSYALCGSLFVGDSPSSRAGGNAYCAVGRSPSSMQLLSTRYGDDASQRAAAVDALLAEDEDGDVEEDESEAAMHDHDHDERAQGLVRNATAPASQAVDMELDAKAIYGTRSLDEGPASPRYDLPADLEADEDEDIRPEDSISVAWMNGVRGPGVVDAGEDEDAECTPVTIEAPDGSRHGMDVDLRGLLSIAELRNDMAQGYRELLGVQVREGSLHIHARLPSGSSVLLCDSDPISEEVLGAVSFYVWVAPAGVTAQPTGEHGAVRPPPGMPSLKERKVMLSARASMNFQ